MPATGAPEAARIEAISPFFIVSDVSRALAFYCDRLGFEVRFAAPGEPPFFAIVGRDRAQLFLKSEAGVGPLPNCERHRHMRWDAFVHVSDPNGLAAEFAARGTAFSRPLSDTQDGLRGFEIADADGYTLFFGHPR